MPPKGQKRGQSTFSSDFALPASPSCLAPLGSLELGLRDTSLLTAGFQVT